MMTRGQHALSLVHDVRRRNVRHEEIVRDYLRGDPIAAIAARYDISAGTVGKIRKQYDLPKRHLGEDAMRVAEILEDYRTGIPVTEITRTRNVDRKTIWRLVRANNIPLRRGRP